MKRLVIITTFLFLSAKTDLPTEKAKRIEFPTTREHQAKPIIIKESVKFEQTVAFIKRHEGFRSAPYLDTRGIPTIGYGCVIKYIKNKELINNITRRQAELLVREKLKECQRYAQKKYPLLNVSQQLAIAHLGYCKGFGTIQRHKIHNQLKEGFINKEDLVNFGDAEKSNTDYQENRRFEYILFNQ